jgi:hypothetical protein
MTGRTYPTLRKAIHYTVRDFCNRDSAKTLLLCEALNCKPSSLSAMTSEYAQDSSRNCSPEDLEIIMTVTGDDSIAMTAADLRGRDTSPKQNRWTELLAANGELLAAANRNYEQMRIMVPLVDAVPVKGKR